MTYALLFLSLMTVQGAGAQEGAATGTMQVTEMAQPAKRMQAAPIQSARPAPSGAETLSGGQALQASAACCLTQCKEGGNCGNKCKVVDSASQCERNLVFECPSSKGLNCFGGKCTCQ